MKVKLKEDIFYSRLTDLVDMDNNANDDDHEFLFQVINTFMKFGKIVQSDCNLDLYMKAGSIIDLKEPPYQGPDYVCNYYGLMLDFTTEGELEVII